MRKIFLIAGVALFLLQGCVSTTIYPGDVKVTRSIIRLHDELIGDVTHDGLIGTLMVENVGIAGAIPVLPGKRTTLFWEKKEPERCIRSVVRFFFDFDSDEIVPDDQPVRESYTSSRRTERIRECFSDNRYDPQKYVSIVVTPARNPLDKPRVEIRYSD